MAKLPEEVTVEKKLLSLLYIRVFHLGKEVASLGEQALSCLKRPLSEESRHSGEQTEFPKLPFYKKKLGILSSELISLDTFLVKSYTPYCTLIYLPIIIVPH